MSNRRPLLVGSRLGPDGSKRMQQAFKDGVPVSALSRRFDLSPFRIRQILQSMAASSSGAVGEGLQIAS